MPFSDNMRAFKPRGSTSALLGIGILSFLNMSACLMTMEVQPDKDSMVTVVSNLEQCTVCTVGGVNDTEIDCHPALSLVPEEVVKLNFDCSQPAEQAYAVTIVKNIECTEASCLPARGEAQTDLLKEFSKTFKWDIKPAVKTIVGLDVLGEGLKEKPDSEPLCPDGFSYVVARVKPKGGIQNQAYCRGGSLTHLDFTHPATFLLQVQPNAAVDVVFSVTASPLMGRTMTVNADPGTTVVLSVVSDEMECLVCQKEGSDPPCNPTEQLTLTDPQSTLLEFSCPVPENVFNAQVKQKIECTKDQCNPATGMVQQDLFSEFSRTLQWDLTIPKKTVLSLDFPGDGLRGKTPKEKCLDGYQYSVSTTNAHREVQMRVYCRAGPVSHLDFLGPTTVTLEVPKGGQVESSAFTAQTAARRGRLMSVIPDPDTTVTISRDSTEPDCSVCEGEEPNQKCNPKELQLRDARNTTVEFSCAQPQDVFSVGINRFIDCTEITCNGNIVQTEASLFPDFNRTFTWDVKAPPTQTFQLDFPDPGMRTISNGETCPDQHTYTIISYLRTGPATIGTYCRGGPLSAVHVRYKGRVSMDIPHDQKLEPLDFKVTVGPETNMLAIVKVNLPRGASDTDFITANYPRDFPDNNLMMWDFAVPGMHNYTVRFLDHTEPECISGVVKVEYKKEGKEGIPATLTDPQPEHQQGNFNMSLFNCQTNRTLEGLTLNFRVSVMRSGHPVLCTVALAQKEGLSLQIEKVGSDPYCEMSLDSEVKQKIDVAPGTKADLSFLDCPSEELRLTASKTIGCQSLDSCTVNETRLTVSKMPSCLPVPLHSFTWHLHVPKDGTVDLKSAVGSFQQSLPGQECNGTVLFHVDGGDGTSIGDFCPKGTIRKIRVHSNVSVITKISALSRMSNHLLNVSFTDEIAESIIYQVSSKASAPALLATPNWPSGMRPSSTVSWIIKLPSHYQADLQFVNISQPKCKERHTSIKVQTLGSEEEMLSRREDEEIEDKLVVPESFYLNMSNCIPEEGHFGAVAKVTLQKKSNILAIILGIVGGLLLLSLIILAVVCLVLKKKKRGKMNAESSIYIGKGNIFQPGKRQFSKTRSDNESHVYDSIDEMMVYGHLLRDSTYGDSAQGSFKGMQVDSYRTFTGPVDGQPPTITETEAEPEPESELYRPCLDPSETFIPSRPRTPIDRQDSLGFQDRRMVDNELYTFKGPGNFNTIRLSGVDLEPDPPINSEEYL